MYGQYGPLTPITGYTQGNNQLSDMISNYNKMKMVQMAEQNMPTELKQKNLAGDLSNQTSQLNLNALPQMLKQQLQSGGLNNQLLQARLAAMQNQDQMPQMASSAGKMINDYYNVVQRFGANSPQAMAMKTMLQKSMGSAPSPQFGIGQNGLQLTPMQQQGGGAQGSPQMGAMQQGEQQSAQPMQQMGNDLMGGDLMSQGSQMAPGQIVAAPGKQGQTLYDTQTGQAVSMPSSAVASQAQQQMLAEAPISETVQSLYSDIAPMLGSGGVAGTANRALQSAGAMLTGASPEMQKYQIAMNNKIPFATEGIISATNLPKTNESITMIKKALTPSSGESADQYKKNIATTLATLALKDQSNKAILAGGFDLTGHGSKKPSLDELTEHYEGILDGKIVDSNATYGQWTGKDINAYAEKYKIPASEVIQRLQQMQQQGAQ